MTRGYHLATATRMPRRVYDAAVNHPNAALGPARTLALVRIVAGLVIAASADVHNATHFAGVPSALVTPPPGLTLLRALSLSEVQAQLLTWAVVLLAILGALGAYARASFALLSAALLVLLALPQRLGAVSHVHHLLWVPAVLAASPCADVWSVDAYFDPRSLGAPARYTLPLSVLRALTAAVYFFPGLHKLLSFLGGAEPGAWMQSHVAWKWLQQGRAAALPFALTPHRFTWLALAAVAFELSMPLLVAFRRTRPLALVSAVLFDVGTAALLFIRFESLAVLWVALLDLPPRSERVPVPTLLREASRPSLWLGAMLVSGALITGVLGETQLYPFACYPTFADVAPPVMPSARLIVARGTQHCSLPRPLGNTQWVEAFRIAGAYGDARTPQRARAYLRTAYANQGGPTRCPLHTDSSLWLVLEELAWDFEANALRVVREVVVYAAPASELGIAPAGSSASSSAPSK